MQLMQTGFQQANPARLSDNSNVVFTGRLKPADLTFEALSCRSLLESAELANISGEKLPSSCRNGTCRTCICKLRSGSITYRIEWPGLSLEEKREGYILPCVAYPLSDVVIETFA